MKNKKGSSIVLLAMVFVTMAACISASIGISRGLVVKSECQTFGKLWGRAILSEYDVHLLDDYGVMAYYGNEVEVQKRINSYLLYSCDSKLDSRITDAEAFLDGMELSEPSNFRTAIKNGEFNDIVSSVISHKGRTNRENPLDNIGSRKIANEVVIDTLPSHGIGSTLDIDTLINTVKNCKTIESIIKTTGNSAIEIAYLNSYLNSFSSTVSDKEGYFKNEWEYVIVGKLDDEANYKSCRRRLFLMRNSLNLVALYEDPTKVKTIAAVAEVITPGAGAATQAVIAEAWAAVETEEDLKTIYSGGRIPIMKTEAEWKTDLSMALSEEDLQLAKETLDEINSEDERDSTVTELSEGLDYEQYLLIMLSFMDENTRLLRIMDIIQINMKYRYYDDFNMSEYFIGVDFYINANGREYEIKDMYK